ncbi:MAG: glycosyltransferase family 9 protein [bacterium]|nr:glycosyltransferase family 9 protein [bacterium]
MKRVLLIKTGAFGDVILTSVSIRIAANLFSDYKIYLLTAHSYSEIYQDCPIIDKIFTLPSKMSLISFLQLIKDVRRLKIEVIVDLQGNLKTNFLCFILGGKKRIGLYKKPVGKLFLTHGIKKQSGFNPISLQEIFWKKVTGKKINGHPQVWIDDKRNRSFHIFLTQHGLEQKKYVVFHPSASPEWQTKLWIKENWFTLAEFFATRNFKVVLIGDKSSMKLNSEIAASMKHNIIDLTGKTDFFLLALLIKNARILLTTDSGPMHIGAAVRTETVAIFGPTNPELHSYPGIKTLKSEIPCSPCYKKKCKKMMCMKFITPQKVVHLLKILKKDS